MRTPSVMAAATAFLVAGAGVPAQSPMSGAALVAALRHGGCVVLMRHASSPAQPPAKADADPANTALERQLDERGRAASAAMGAALRRLGIAVGEVWTSPTYRARETARLAGFDQVRTDEHLGDRGQSMQGATDEQAAWLRTRVATQPQSGNTLVITHQPNLARAFPNAADVADGECLIFQPDGRGGATLAGRIRIEDWPRLEP